MIDRFNSDIDELATEDQIKTGIIRKFVKTSLTVTSSGFTCGDKTTTPYRFTSSCRDEARLASAEIAKP